MKLSNLARSLPKKIGDRKIKREWDNKRIKERDWCVGVGVDKRISQNAFLRGGNEFIRQVGLCIFVCVCVCVCVPIVWVPQSIKGRWFQKKIAEEREKNLNKNKQLLQQ